MEDIVNQPNKDDTDILLKKGYILNDKSPSSNKKTEEKKTICDVKKVKKKKKKKRCPICENKLTLVEQNIICKCNRTYCTKHRLPHTHNCNFNFKDNKKNNITENNPSMSFKKIDEI
jgi:predicted nucleic acid binding AN1-type Zn finger protein